MSVANRAVHLNGLPLVLTVPEVAEHLQVSTSTVHEMCTRGDLRDVRVGRYRRIARPALAALLGLRDPSEVEVEQHDEQVTSRDGVPELRVAR